MFDFDKDNVEVEGKAIVVGGSLSGLMSAIALADRGIEVEVLEKAKEGVRTGAGLQVDGSSFYQTKIEKKLRRLASEGESTTQLWGSIESRLREEAYRNSNINLNFNTRVTSIGQDDEKTWAETKDGERYEGDILIGADGHRSMVREKISPDHSDAKFAGYVVWMASVPEEELPKESRPNMQGQKVEMLNTIGGFLFGSVIEDKYGKRRVGTTWYDNTNSEMLYRLGAVEGKVVHHSLEGEAMPQEDIDSLIEQAKGKWPEPWLTASIQAIRSRGFMGIPIKEYVPEKLSKGRFAIIGDAAHVPAPITASGFNESLVDAVVLNKCVSAGIQGTKASEALDEYQLRRLSQVQRMVESGKSFSRSFGRYY